MQKIQNHQLAKFSGLVIQTEKQEEIKGGFIIIDDTGAE